MSGSREINHKYGSDFNITFRKISEDDIDMIRDFDCGNRSINDFIREESLDSKKDVTYIFSDTENENIIAFCSICCNGISVCEDNGDKVYATNYPAIDIDFFAVDESYRSIPFDESSNRYETLSNALFSFMIKYISDIATKYVGATHICLYAVPKAKNFYKRCGFIDFEPYMNRDEAPFLEGCIPMFIVL